MLKVWQFSSVITLIQLISVFLFCDLTLKDPFDILYMLMLVSIIISIVAFIVRIPMKNDMLISKARIFISTTLVSGFFVGLGITYVKYVQYKGNGSIYGTLITVLFALFLLAFHIFSIVQSTKKLEPKGNTLLIILCSLPLGIGMIFGGIAGKLLKKF